MGRADRPGMVLLRRPPRPVDRLLVWRRLRGPKDNGQVVRGSCRSATTAVGARRRLTGRPMRFECGQGACPLSASLCDTEKQKKYGVRLQLSSANYRMVALRDMALYDAGVRTNDDRLLFNQYLVYAFCPVALTRGRRCALLEPIVEIAGLAITRVRTKRILGPVERTGASR